MLTRWNHPNDGNGSLMPLMEVFFKDPFFREVAPQGPSTLVPPADVVETEEAFEVSLDLPGHAPESIQLKVENDTLLIQAERRKEREAKGQVLRTERSYGVFSRSFGLPKTVDGSRCDARYDNGVLTVVLPKREEAKPRSIEIKVRS
jgi:HSP20 family protein